MPLLTTTRLKITEQISSLKALLAQGHTTISPTLAWGLVVISTMLLLGSVFLFSDISWQPQNDLTRVLPSPSATLAPEASPELSPLPTPTVAGIETTLPLPKGPKVYVSPTGNNTFSGSSAKEPFQTISHALSQVKPGTTIVVLPGTYNEHITTKVHGTKQSPITLQAQGKVILKTNTGRIMEVHHNYYRISGFEFSGGDIQLWLQRARYTAITNNFFHDAQGECVRFKYHAAYNTFEKNRIERCGREDFAGSGDGKNGEGVYLGTAPEQLSRNPSPEVDHTNYNVIRNNFFDTQGNECVDMKEGSSYNVIEFNECTGQKDPDSAGLDSRGNQNIFRYNYVYNNLGAGIRFGGDTTSDGLSNEAYGNKITGNKGYGIKIQRLPQKTICGNIFENNQADINQKEVTNGKCSFPLKTPGRLK